MDRSDLAARIQEILAGRRKPAGESPAPAGPRPAQRFEDEEAAFAARCASAEASSRVTDVLGGALVDGDGGSTIVVDRVFPAAHRHGRHAVDDLAGAARDPWCVLPRLLERAPEWAGGAPGGAGLLFFDLETTGLAGGAGTYAFLVGFGLFAEDGFRTRQFLLRGYGEERGLLQAVTAFVAGSPQPPVLVTYNGRSFDVPLVETRYQMNRRRSPFDRLAHVDMLYPARRLWKKRPPPDRPGGWAPDDVAAGSCALTAIERDVLGLAREDDVPGWEIPSRYFAYTRTGDARGLEAVLEHNRLDLLSLAAVTAVVLEMAGAGASVPRSRADCAGLGRLMDYLERPDEAERCFEAAAAERTDSRADGLVRADALRWLALHRRRSRRFREAAEAWLELTQVPGIDPAVRREALEALAVHNEHRAKDLEAARQYALEAGRLSADDRRVGESRRRVDRLSRKIGGGAGGAGFTLDPSA